MANFTGTEDPVINGQRDMVTRIGNKVRDAESEETIASMARATWPHWWQRGKRKQWAEGYRLAYARISNIIWHSMP